MPHPATHSSADSEETEMDWAADAACRGQTRIYFAPVVCALVDDCRSRARRHREYGFWGGESEEERAAAGFRPDMPVGRIARYPRGDGMPVQLRPNRQMAPPGQVLTR